jgi:acyl carrier protein
MKRDEIKSKVLVIIQEQFALLMETDGTVWLNHSRQEKVSEDTSFEADLGGDSLDRVELLMEFEDAFDISIPDDDSEKIATVGGVIDYIQEKLKNA